MLNTFINRLVFPKLLPNVLLNADKYEAYYYYYYNTKEEILKSTWLFYIDKACM